MQVVHEAAFIGRVEGVRVLMELSADKCITMMMGKHQQTAESRGYEPIVVLLREQR
jgi:hypothetical protein